LGQSPTSTSNLESPKRLMSGCIFKDCQRTDYARPIRNDFSIVSAEIHSDEDSEASSLREKTKLAEKFSRSLHLHSKDASSPETLHFIPNIVQYLIIAEDYEVSLHFHFNSAFEGDFFVMDPLHTLWDVECLSVLLRQKSFVVDGEKKKTARKVKDKNGKDEYPMMGSVCGSHHSNSSEHRHLVCASSLLLDDCAPGSLQQAISPLADVIFRSLK
ncbi:hypothetical protein STEG23_016240, partial [Scotinomys teguina]